MMFSTLANIYWPFVSFQKNVYSGPLPIFNRVIIYLLLSCKSSYVLDINAFFLIHGFQIFSQIPYVAFSFCHSLFIFF